MINSVSANSQIAQVHQTQANQQNTSQSQKSKQKEVQDTVQLSKQATGTGDVDHDGDSH